MELLKLIQESGAVYRLGWVLLHTLWLGTAVAMLLAVAMVALRRRSANARYLAGCIALAAMVALPVAAFFLVPTPAGPPQVDDASVAPAQLAGAAPAGQDVEWVNLPAADVPSGPVAPPLGAAEFAPVASSDPPPFPPATEGRPAPKAAQAPLLTRASGAL